ncbi:hypothetical protein DNTS_035504 [Danionella cerebrum]|uniref:MYND-type domain-containing protein n=1 Tax=Danionella cerebrum TaxID=2873325 RepID=A0A553RG85_9TELE|nr:hypothetical protein DNTS_035504 [Danionella translucida]
MQFYKGSFFKDYRHGKGTYCWPDGSKYTGKFYLNQKEGYGVHVFSDGSMFQGLYHAGERFGPGVMTYPDGCQDVGLWHRERLLRMCSTLADGFSLQDFPEYMRKRPQTDWKLHVEPLETDQGLLEDEEHFVLPPDIQSYSTDSDHLPIPRGLRQELDQHFFGTGGIRTQLATVALPLQQRINAHIHRHRTQFADRGPLERISERLIREAAQGEVRSIFRILRDEKVHPDVSDARGHTALIAATVRCHDDVINMLLDSGADVNQLNDEGMSALSACGVLYYPLHSLHETLAEKVTQNSSLDPQGNPEDYISHDSTSAAKVEPEQSKLVLESENYCDTKERIHDDINADQSEEVHMSEEPQEAASRPRSIQVYDGSISLGCVSWKERDEEPEEDLKKEFEKSLRFDEWNFDSACSMASFPIEVTEEILQKSAEMLSQTQRLRPSDAQETVRAMALLKTEHRKRWATIELLLERGADPNASIFPMPVIFLAVKASHVMGVRRLLECGARTDIPLPPELKGLYPLHIAAGLPGAEGPEITELLLHALADPDLKAQDAHEAYPLDKCELSSLDDRRVLSSGIHGSFSEAPPLQFPQEGGRTALHVACQRDSEYAFARDVVALLLSRDASRNEVWSGHSPLSLAIASGNDLAVDELLSRGADPNLRLTRQVGSALCALANINYDRGPQQRNLVKLLEKLVKAGADILMPVLLHEGRRCTLGTAVDYAHITFQQNQRMAHTPYHALSKQERQAYTARCQLLGLMGDLLREGAVRRESEKSLEERCVSSSLLSSAEIISSRTLLSKRRRPGFRFCFECGRSVGVLLTPCGRCHRVLYCSKSCKSRAWEQRHREECVRAPVIRGETSSVKGEASGARSPLSAKDVKAKTFRLNFSPDLQEYDTSENYSFN